MIKHLIICYSFFYKLFATLARAYIENVCEKKHFGSAIVKFYNDATEHNIAGRVSVIIAFKFGIDFKSNFKLLATDWTKNEIDQFDNFTKGNTYCLQNFPHKIFQSCGNGFVEANEECDCGLSETCNNLCCDPKTCKRQTHCDQQNMPSKETVTVNSPPKLWQCDNGHNINESVLCNGLRDCNDGSDETITHCFGRSCPANLFRCR